MGLDIWFSEDIRNALLAADEASSSTARVAAEVADLVTLRAYLEGYRAALSTIALAFGLSPGILSKYIRPEGVRLVEGPGGIPSVGKEEGEGKSDVVYIVPDRIWKRDTGEIS